MRSEAAGHGSSHTLAGTRPPRLRQGRTDSRVPQRRAWPATRPLVSVPNRFRFIDDHRHHRQTGCVPAIVLLIEAFQRRDYLDPQCAGDRRDEIAILIDYRDATHFPSGKAPRMSPPPSATACFQMAWRNAPSHSRPAQALCSEHEEFRKGRNIPLCSQHAATQVSSLLSRLHRSDMDAKPAPMSEAVWPTGVADARFPTRTARHRRSRLDQGFKPKDV